MPCILGLYNPCWYCRSYTAGTPAALLLFSGMQTISSVCDAHWDDTVAGKPKLRQQFDLICTCANPLSSAASAWLLATVHAPLSGQVCMALSSTETARLLSTIYFGEMSICMQFTWKGMNALSSAGAPKSSAVEWMRSNASLAATGAVRSSWKQCAHSRCRRPLMPVTTSSAASSFTVSLSCRLQRLSPCVYATQNSCCHTDYILYTNDEKMICEIYS